MSETSIRASGAICVMDGCHGTHVAKGMCGKHYQKLRKHGSPLYGRSKKRDGQGNIAKGYLRVQENGVSKLAHIFVAERALGKPLPKGAVVHHVNENRLDNRNANLVICSRSYHLHLHVRMRAIAASGNPDFRKCPFCKKHDDIKNMSPRCGRFAHKVCVAVYDKSRNSK